MQAQEQQVELKLELDRVQKEIAQVNEEIRAVEKKIENVEAKLDASSSLSVEDKQYLRQEKARLGQKEDRLRQKEDRLGQDKSRLIEVIYMKRLPAIPENTESAVAPIWTAKHDKLFLEMHQATVKRDRATPQKNPSTLGKDELTRIQKEGKLSCFSSIEGKPSVLSDEAQRTLQQLQTEHEVVAFLTPFLEEIFGKPGESTIVVVNSEEYRWLKVSDDKKYNQKPDLFVCHKALFKPKQAFQTQNPRLIQLRKPESLYGVLARWCTRRFVELVCEAKLKISNAALGEIINYGAHLCFEEDGPVTVRLLLFDTQEFWLVEAVKGTASSIQKCQWTQPGSQSALRNFALRSPLIEVLDAACHHFGLTAEENSFLGEGASGIVFRVRSRDHRALALKIVPDKEGHRNGLEIQRAITDYAFSKCPDTVVAVEPDGYKHFEGKGAVLLLSEAGDHYSNLKRSDIVEALDDLHAQDILHGDARVENVVSVNGKPKWIDLRRGVYFYGQNVAGPKAQEMKDLKASLDRVHPL